MRISNFLGAAILTAASVVTAEEKYGNGLPCANDICFTSWLCSDNRCNAPSYGSRWEPTVWDIEYYISWVGSNETQTEDIVFEWLIFETPGSPLSAISNQTNQTMTYSTDGPVNFIVAYSQKIEKGSTYFKFAHRKDFFPNPLLNLTYLPVSGYASERNIFRIYHPNTFDPKNESTWDVSSPFTVLRPEEYAMILHAQGEGRKSDDRKLVTGLGVGIAVAWTVAFVVAWFAGGWFQKRQLQKKDLLFKTTQQDQE